MVLQKMCNQCGEGKEKKRNEPWIVRRRSFRRKHSSQINGIKVSILLS
jgi:hypothetical protein